MADDLATNIICLGLGIGIIGGFIYKAMVG